MVSFRYAFYTALYYLGLKGRRAKIVSERHFSAGKNGAVREGQWIAFF
jgi:hypothetical protein